MKLRVPLDFQAVTDHAMYLGMVPAMFDTSTDVSKHPVATGLREAKPHSTAAGICVDDALSRPNCRR